MDRRDFLIRAGVSGAALAIAGGAERTVTAVANGRDPWKGIRSQFDELSPDKIHLSSFFLVSHPRPVREAIEFHRRAIDENPFDHVEKHIFTMPGQIAAAAAD